jgi:myo-inositol-1(or 4)-monophosphatase
LRVAEPELAPDEITHRLTTAVREAGELALAKFGAPIRSWIKGKNSPVCEADVEVDQLLRERLAGPTPDYGWLSEESTDDPARLAARRVWVVDPIDGTRGFIAGMPDWAISVALVEDGRPLAAALFAPVFDELMVAIRGAGATRNGEALWCGPDEGLDGARVAGPERRLERLAALVPAIARMPKVHSLALRLARVATGVLDVALAGPNSRDWDLAAADLLVHEAGGAVTALDGRVPTYNRADPVHGALFAAGRNRHASLLAVVRGRASDFA